MNAKTLTGLAVTAAVVVGAAMYISKDSGSSAPVVTVRWSMAHSSPCE